MCNSCLVSSHCKANRKIHAKYSVKNRYINNDGGLNNNVDNNDDDDSSCVDDDDEDDSRETRVQGGWRRCACRDTRGAVTPDRYKRLTPLSLTLTWRLAASSWPCFSLLIDITLTCALAIKFILNYLYFSHLKINFYFSLQFMLKNVKNNIFFTHRHKYSYLRDQL